MKFPNTLTAHEQAIPKELLGPLRDSVDSVGNVPELNKRLIDDGYLFLRGALERDRVMEARAVVLSRLAAVGEIEEPFLEGISTGTSRRGEVVDNLGAFWQSLCECPEVRKVSHSGRIVSIMRSLFDGDVRAFDFLWMRTMHPGRASAYHFDHVYMNRGSVRLLTVWTPLGDVGLEEGPLALVEGSHRWEDMISEYRGFDVDKDKSRPGHVTLDPVSLVRERDSRLLTEEFRAGDVVIFPMFMLHGSLDNRSRTGRVRLSVDTRFQPADDPVDERWVGPDPVGHGGGYGAMSGAQPATSDPLFR